MRRKYSKRTNSKNFHLQSFMFLQQKYAGEKFFHNLADKNMTVYFERKLRDQLL